MNVDKLITKSEQVKALAYTLEGEICDADLYNAGEQSRRVADLFYLLQEQIETLTELVHEIGGHIEVCNAIYAVNRIDELKTEIERLKLAQ